eukprot:10123390-Ditylum_brightwellii.AAC.1
MVQFRRWKKYPHQKNQEQTSCSKNWSVLGQKQQSCLRITFLRLIVEINFEGQGIHQHDGKQAEGS